MEFLLKSIPISSPIPVPRSIQEAISRLSAGGFESYLVGGSVRDFLLGIESKDHDIATSAQPDEIESLFPGSNSVGKAFGVIKVPAHHLDPSAGRDEEPVEITTFRKDLEYQDHRHPVAVEFSNAEEDSRRRDFTINALYYDFSGKSVLDFVDGKRDLDQKCVRAIGEARVRFDEDALRLIRAVRFASRLGFEIEENTFSAIKESAHLIQTVSKERLRNEMTLILQSEGVGEGLEILSQTGLDQYLFPEVKINSQLIARLKHLVGIEKEIRTVGVWAGFLFDLKLLEVKSILKKFRLSSREIQSITFILERAKGMSQIFSLRESERLRFYFEEHFDLAIKVYRSGDHCSDTLKRCEEERQQFKKWIVGKTIDLLNGQDLQELGISPGPHFSEILDEVKNRVLERKINSREEALKFVQENYSDLISGGKS